MDEFIIQTRMPEYADRHCFIEDEMYIDSDEEHSSSEKAVMKNPDASYSQVMDQQDHDGFEAYPVCEIQILDQDEEKKASNSPPKVMTTDSAEKKYRKQCVLEDFGYGDIKPTLKFGEDGEDSEDGMGAGAYSNSLDHSNLRFDIKKALQEYDEVALASAIDIARDMGQEYPHQ